MTHVFGCIPVPLTLGPLKINKATGTLIKKHVRKKGMVVKSPHHLQIITLVDKVLRIGQLANFGAFSLLPQQHGQRILKLAEFDVPSCISQTKTNPVFEGLKLKPVNFLTPQTVR